VLSPAEAMGDKRDRVRIVVEKLEEIDLEALLVTDIRNIRYLTGFTGSSGFILLSEDRSIFITDFRYKTQAEEEVSDFELRIEKGKLPDIMEKLVRELDLKTIGFEANAPFDHYKKLSERLSGIELTPATDLIETLRAVKDDEELIFIRRAIAIAEESFNSILNLLRPGIIEKDIALSLEYEIRKGGSGLLPFDIIVASGERSALPHATSSRRSLEEGDLVIIDWGAQSDGYFCDITRTFMVGSNPPSPTFNSPLNKGATPPILPLVRGGEGGVKGGMGGFSDKRKIYEIVLDAQKEAIQKVRPGMTFSELDAVARDFIEDAGYGEYFGHGLGHGVGLSVHEAPHIFWQGEGVLEEGMVFTIEPGIYIPGLGGARIEDMVLVKEKGAEVLTHLPKELLFI
jgi:Xaa-Pro aminopeptidase